MKNFVGIGIPEDEPTDESNPADAVSAGELPVVYQVATTSETALTSSPENSPGAPNPAIVEPAKRVRRVRIVQFSAPALLVEATPDAALDIQGFVAGIKQIEPNPADCEADACGSLYFTLIISYLYNFQDILANIEALNQHGDLDACYQECEIDTRDF